jgi:hypothetical protein
MSFVTLRRARTREVRIGDARPVHDAITYVESHRDLPGYPGARSRGLPIGSGITKAKFKTLFTMRLKRAARDGKSNRGRGRQHPSDGAQ